jgi:predicted nucleotidyltransferase
LQALIEAGRTSAHLHQIAAVEFLRDARIAELPDTAFELACLVSKNQVQIRLVGLGGSLLFGEHKKKSDEEFAFFEVRQVGNVNVFHGMSGR